MIKNILYIIFIIIIYELFITYNRKRQRRFKYYLAKQRSLLTGKKLLVIGDPYNGLANISTGIDYDCGDLCIDLTGCPKCNNGIKGKLEDIIKNINLDDYIIYISCVLEYVDDFPLILNYLNKINQDDLFIVNVEWYSLSAYFYPYFITKERPPKYIIYNTKPFIKYFNNFIL
jgi:hypothetical protein